MFVKPIDRSSPLFPLPEDYLQLTDEGQRQARVNACRLWTVQDPQYWGADLLPASVNFFDEFYLKDSESLFYPPHLLRANPPFHDDVLSAIASYKYNVVGAPRDSSKSTLMEKSMGCMAVSCPMFQISYLTSTNRNVNKRMATLKRLFMRNTRLISDWGPENSDGRLLPPRGAAPLGGGGEFHLQNAARIFLSSITSRNRGDRPNLLILDDPEWDSTASTDTTRLREELSEYLFHVLLPMIQQEGCGLVWLGTTVSRKHLLWTVLKGEDARFKFWNKMHFKALYTQDDGSTISLWPEKYSVERLAQLRQEMGEPAFRAEYMNEPAAGDGSIFWMDPKRHGWYVSGMDDAYRVNPRESETIIEYEGKNGPVSMPLADLLRESLVFSTVDWAQTVSETSDWSVVCTMALTHDSELIVLDLDEGKITGSHLANMVLKAAYKWRPSVIGVEAPNIEFHLLHQIKTLLEDQIARTGYVPRVEPLPHYKQSKQERIEGLQWRFGDPNDPEAPTRIKLPLWQLEGGKQLLTKGPWRRLHQQIMDFVPTIRDGGLEKDDHIDAVSMAQSIIPKLPAERFRAKPKVINPIQLALNGELYDDFGMPVLAGVDIGSLPKGTIEAIKSAVVKRHGSLQAANPGVMGSWEIPSSSQRNLI